ncbi:hypothetical protein [Flavobacterium sp.]|uniref:hypothetical protein n=1 Tax=Flavobacterium sp. TaxID=239 RepID=UPI002626DC3E|nr:hypothetical protein [Flavobacterium sp.]
MCFNFFGFSQSGEFKIYDNGLIYSENTMNKLVHIVDSLNLKFKLCDKNSKFFSQKTAQVNYLKIEGDDADNLKMDIEKKLSYNQILKKYPKIEKIEDLILTKFIHTNKYSKNNIKYYSTIETDKVSNYYLDFKESEVLNDSKGSWLFKYYPKGKYNESSIRCFYIVKEFKNKEIPKKYSELIQYSECLIDSNSEVFLENNKENKFQFLSDTTSNDFRIFMNFIDDKLKKPFFPSKLYQRKQELSKYNSSGLDINDMSEEEKEFKEEYKKVTKEYYNYINTFEKWQNDKSERVDSLKNNDENFIKLLKNATTYIEKNEYSSEELEDYVGKYISKAKALKMKRSRVVTGSCSMDDSPRRHAQKITFLAAETSNWDVFIKSHLNIMNDSFESVAYSNFGQLSKRTYIKELEELNINVIDLLLGITFRIETQSKNHYFGSISRIGQAIADSKNKDEFEQKATLIISDKKLDDYNRLLVFYLFRNYNNYLKDESRKKNNISKLNLLLNKLPQNLSSKIVVN